MHKIYTAAGAEQTDDYTIKNIGMGCGSRAGKMEQHCDGKPSVNKNDC